MNIRDELLSVTDKLNSEGLAYAVCGGLAVVMHGYPRLTRDIDLLIDEQDASRVQEALISLGYDLEPGLIRFRGGQPDEQRLFRLTKIAGMEFMTVDLLLASGAQQDIWESRIWLEVEGRRISVLSRAGLIKMKRISGRLQDRLDISLLEGNTGDS